MRRFVGILVITAIVLSIAACDRLIEGSREDPPPCDNRGAGDINLNGLQYEIADAIMFTNYFVNGLSAFGTHIEESIRATDLNGDCNPLSVADLVYLFRKAIGDAPPYNGTSPVSASITRGNEVFSVDTKMGAAHIVMSGNNMPTLLADNMEMKYASDGQITRILIFSTAANQSFRGDFLQVAGDIVSTEFATFRGATVVSRVQASAFIVEQNFPNPFNPTTTIRFTVPSGGAWSMVIRNYTGSTVAQFSGYSESGYESVVWDATGLAAGTYLYTVTAAGQSITKKATLQH